MRCTLEGLPAVLAEHGIDRPDNALLGERLAIWQVSGGRPWPADEVAAGRALALPTNGYPDWYLLRASDVVPTVLAGPPGANERWGYGAGDVLTERWDGRTTIDEPALRACDPDEWLVAEFWDES